MFPRLRVKRLHRLIKVLERVEERQVALRLRGLPSRKFVMAHFADRGDRRTVGLSENLCGTSACALGWAATDSQFKRAGLRLWFYHGEPDGMIVFGKLRNMAAGAKFFGLTGYETDRLFGVHHGDDVRYAIRRIESVIEDRKEIWDRRRQEGS